MLGLASVNRRMIGAAILLRALAKRSGTAGTKMRADGNLKPRNEYNLSGFLFRTP